MKIIARNLKETEVLAREIASKAQKTDVIALFGDLGAGKSAFSRAFIKALNPEITEVPSPTFNLVQIYSTPVAEVWHCDFYRLKSPDEVMELGWEEALSEGILLVEWPQNIGSFLPTERLEIYFKTFADDSDKREIEVIPKGAKYAEKYR